jgi:hypothetical protein
MNRGVERLSIVFGKTLAPGQRLGIQHFIKLESQIARTQQRLGHEPDPPLIGEVSLGRSLGAAQDD